MSIKERAAKLLTPNSEHCQRLHNGEGGDPCMFCEYNAETAAEMLADAGLLALELPEPSRGMFPRGAVWYLPGPIGDIRRMGEDIVAFGHDCRSQPFRLVLTEAETETIAHTLLAATNHSEHGHDPAVV